ncbi:MAG: aminotransferase class V-fold PLP-dependent enzyme [Gemmatimonadales bacterium]
MRCNVDRRALLQAGAGLALARRWRGGPPSSQDPRAAFARLRNEVFLNAAGGTPLGSFAEAGIARYLDFARLGPEDGRGEYFARVLGGIRGRLARLLGADEAEIALVQCTKAGEHLVLDRLDPIGTGRNVVTNDLHFSGSLHHLEGLRRQGLDLRMVRATGWDVPLEAMDAAIDRSTALVAVTLLSNVTGRIEPLRELVQLAHERGALVYADVIQAAGSVPMDLAASGVDFAAGNGYKWLFGVHGSGFLYVRREHQGTVLPDRLFPGHVRFNYPPWVTSADPATPPLSFDPPADARRYEPGHHAYLAYAALFEGLGFLEARGIEAIRDHSVRLNRRLAAGLDPRRYRSVSVDLDRSPIAAFAVEDAARLEPRLRAARLVVTLTGNLVRVSPAIYNDEEDIDRLIETLNAPG